MDTHKLETLGKNKSPMMPPSKVVASTVTTRCKIPLGLNPAPRNKAPRARPSGILCTQTARMIEKFATRAVGVADASAWWPAAMAKPSTVQ